MPDTNSKFQTPDLPAGRHGPLRLFLIGMPAAGKTYWAKQIADQYNMQVLDLDVYISGKEQASISALFASYGEKGFREKEHTYLQKLIDSTTADTVIACGGGTPCFYNNMELMKNAGKVIYLQAETPTLLLNIKQSDEIRPLLRGKQDIAAYLDELLKKRKEFYEQAHYILPTKDTSLATFAEIIASCTNKL